MHTDANHLVSNLTSGVPAFAELERKVGWLGGGGDARERVTASVRRWGNLAPAGQLKMRLMLALAALERKVGQAPGMAVGMAVHLWGRSTLLMMWQLANTALSCFLTQPRSLPTVDIYLMSDQVSFRPCMHVLPAGWIGAHGNNSTEPDRPVAWTIW